MTTIKIGTVFGVILALLAAASPALAGDPAEAERQYRVARRLAAEGSPEARQALLRVLEEDPAGAMADDARVELALLEGLPRWPEELGRLEPAGARVAREHLDAVVNDLSGADRLPEARYYRALLQLEPLTGHDASSARLDLFTVAANPQAGAWSRSARYAVAWLSEQQGEVVRASAAYHRLLVDAPESTEAARAAVGLARLDLREGRVAEAARWLQAGVEASVPASLQPIELRELAMRHFLIGLGERPALGTQEPVMPSTGIRSTVGIASGRDGVLIGDSKTGAAILFDANGKVRDRWALEDLSAVAADPLGRFYAAAGTTVYQLRPGGVARALAETGDWSPVSAIAAEASGRLWLLDRRGESLGRLEPGGRQVQSFWTGKSQRLAGLAWDGRRLVASESRQRAIVTLDGDGKLEPLVLQGVQKPGVLTCDPTGRIAVHDAKADQIALYSVDGHRLGQVDLRAAGIEDLGAMAFQVDGALNVFDEDGGAWVRLP